MSEHRCYRIFIVCQPSDLERNIPSLQHINNLQMFLSRQRLISLLLVVTLPFCVVSDDQAAENNYNDYNENGDGYNDWKKQYLYDAQSVDDSINYWTSFHIRAKRCVVYKNKDVIVFELFGGGNQCMDNQQLVGTYYTPVPYYMEGYLNEVQQKMEDRGVDDYVEPDVAQYQYCTPKEVNGEVLYLQLGCEDDTTRAIAVNVYSDNTCETRAPNNNGIDDANMDVTDIEVGWCCVCRFGLFWSFLGVETT